MENIVLSIDKIVSYHFGILFFLLKLEQNCQKVKNNIPVWVFWWDCCSLDGLWKLGLWLPHQKTVWQARSAPWADEGYCSPYSWTCVGSHRRWTTHVDGDKSTHKHMTDAITVSPAGEFCIPVLTKTSHVNIRSEPDMRQDSSLKSKDWVFQMCIIYLMERQKVLSSRC